MRTSIVVALLLLSGCGVPGPVGPAGPSGADGVKGSNGADGTNGMNGMNGTNGADGAPGPAGPQGPPGLDFDAGTPTPRPIVGLLHLTSSTGARVLQVTDYELTGLRSAATSGSAGAGRLTLDELSFTVAAPDVAALTADLVAMRLSAGQLEVVGADGGTEVLAAVTDASVSGLRSLGTVDAEQRPLWELRLRAGTLRLQWDGADVSWNQVSNTGSCGGNCDCGAAPVAVGPFAQSADPSWPLPPGATWLSGFEQDLRYEISGSAMQARVVVEPARLTGPLRADAACALHRLGVARRVSTFTVDLVEAPAAPPSPHVVTRFSACGPSALVSLRIAPVAGAPVSTLAVAPLGVVYESALADGGVSSAGVRVDTNSAISACP